MGSQDWNLICHWSIELQEYLFSILHLGSQLACLTKKSVDLTEQLYFNWVEVVNLMFD